MATLTGASKPHLGRFRRWLFEGVTFAGTPLESPAHTYPWWKVMCLTGVDYFSTLGYQPGIAFLAAADAAAHVIENPYVPRFLNHPEAVTLVLLAVLGAVFVRGFREAIGLAVGIVFLYLALNAVLLVACVRELALHHPGALTIWRRLVNQTFSSPLATIAVAFLLYPKLALGLSGFETGVAVMPLIRGDKGDNPAGPAGRIRNTKRLLLSAALIMSVFLIGSSLVTTLLIPTEAFQEGGPANGRALAYLAHELPGGVFGTIYDFSTIAILWFAGASAMAGLLNLVPRYLPPYGMAPEWA